MAGVLAAKFFGHLPPSTVAPAVETAMDITPAWAIPKGESEASSMLIYFA